jgi:hypothetical protein
LGFILASVGFVIGVAIVGTNDHPDRNAFNSTTGLPGISEDFLIAVMLVSALTMVSSLVGLFFRKTRRSALICLVVSVGVLSAEEVEPAGEILVEVSVQ